MSMKEYFDVNIQLNMSKYWVAVSSNLACVLVHGLSIMSTIKRTDLTTEPCAMLAQVKFDHFTGSGSIFEALRLGKPLIVVVNEDLMDNHQSELAEELAERKHLLFARPQTLHQVIKSIDLESLIPYPPADATPVARHINRFLGFPDD